MKCKLMAAVDLNLVNMVRYTSCLIERGIVSKIIDITVKVKVVSIRQVGDTGKHGLTLINRLSTLFNHKYDCNNLEI